MEPEQIKSKGSVIELLAVTVPKTSGNHRVDIQRKKTIRYTLLLFSYHSQGFGRWKVIERPTARTRLVEKVFIPGRSQAPERKEKEYKNGDPHKKGT